ncbi:hypothetical protein B0H12DRAFT_1030459 [Mycena haematopus]|nr:hypothetical protein B0H12DRAFT_1030459 [Mycena haematopus]
MCCADCLKDLDNSDDKRPCYSLANNMWTGDLPFELKTLAFAEQLLLSLVYPRVYTFKLYPKVPGKFDESQLKTAMRGNVTSYELDMSGIAKMLEGNLIPRPPAVLASVVSITFVGIGKIPKSWLRTTFRVRRQVVARALAWLIRNNRHFQSYKLDEARLLGLPEDDVPQEILSIVRINEDDGVVEEEEGGYVPQEGNQK